jgi:crossover junction endodeoxyribonuclease RusA
VTIAFTVPGRPVPAKRMTQRSKYVSPEARRHLYHKGVIGWAARAAGVRPISGPVRLECRFYVCAPLPDVSNLLKLVEDALNGIAYEDDRQVADAHPLRFLVWRRDEQRTEVEVGPMGEGDGVA